MVTNAKIGFAVMNPRWSIKAHIPAVLALPDYELRAVGVMGSALSDTARKVKDGHDVKTFDAHSLKGATNA